MSEDVTWRTPEIVEDPLDRAARRYLLSERLEQSGDTSLLMLWTFPGAQTDHRLTLARIGHCGSPHAAGCQGPVSSL
jgi:hypothetical protein